MTKGRLPRSPREAPSSGKKLPSDLLQRESDTQTPFQALPCGQAGVSRALGAPGASSEGTLEVPGPGLSRWPPPAEASTPAWLRAVPWQSGRPSLKLLAERILGIRVQQAEHCSVSVLG